MSFLFQVIPFAFSGINHSVVRENNHSCHLTRFHQSPNALFNKQMLSIFNQVWVDISYGLGRSFRGYKVSTLGYKVSTLGYKDSIRGYKILP